MSEQNNYDLLIIGAGPAGLTASIYASRFKLNNLIIGEALGGLAFEAHKICNFPTEEDISGMDLINKMKNHVEALGANILLDKIVSINKLANNQFEINTQNNKKFITKTILLATGTEHRKLDLPNEKEYVGKGVSYCATCDAMFYKDKTVAVIGGGNSAHTAALYLAEIADKVYQIYRGDKLRGERAWIEQVEQHEKIEVIFNTQIKDLQGEGKLEKIILDQPYKEKTELAVSGLFVEIGTVPQKELITALNLETNEQGYVKATKEQKTNQDNIWVAGDISDASNDFHQIITACSEGAIVAENIFKSLQAKK